MKEEKRCSKCCIPLEDGEEDVCEHCDPDSNSTETIKSNKEVKNKMATVKELAENYVPASSLTIADLEAVSASQEIIEKTYKKDTDDEYTNNVIVQGDKDYRVPDTVLKQLKVMIAEKPEMTTFKVKKEGEGITTTYTVIPLD